MVFSLDSKTWAAQQFAACELGDKRRTNRIIKIAEQIANNPSGSFCEQMEIWSDLKAAYRLFDKKEVTFEAVARPHWVRWTPETGPGNKVVFDTLILGVC